MSAEPNFSELSFDAVIPSALLINENIEPSAIKLYAFIRGLTRVEGYCYATNSYLAKCIKQDESNVKRLLASLKAEGFIEIHTDKNGIHWQRRIYIGVNFNKSLRRLKNEPPPAQFCAPPSSKMSYILENSRIEDIKNKIPPSADAAALVDFFISKLKEKKPNFSKTPTPSWLKTAEKLLNVRKLEELKKVIEFSFNDEFWFKNILSPEKLLKHLDALELKMSQPNVPKSTGRSNQEWAKILQSRFKERNDILIGNEGVSFFGGQSQIHIRYDENGFKDQIINRLRLMNLSIQGL